MGAKGMRRRKKHRPLPPPDVPTENDLVPPNIMWPSSGSGFEADPYSPAGRAQRDWWMLQGLERRSRRHSYSLWPLTFFLGAFLLLLLAMMGLGYVLSLIP